MARYWVGDSRERRVRAAEPSVTEDDRPRSRRARTGRERVTDAVRRTLAGNVTADDTRD